MLAKFWKFFAVRYNNAYVFTIAINISQFNTLQVFII